MATLKRHSIVVAETAAVLHVCNLKQYLLYCSRLHSN